LDNLDFQGCGGHSRDLLVGQEWIVQDLNQQGVIDFSRLTMTFDDQGRLSGFTSCNQYSTAYEFNERLDIASAITTQKVCPVAIMNQEKLFLSILTDVESLDISINGALILKTADGRTITARR
jgi:heat shock protein HslJ